MGLFFSTTACIMYTTGILTVQEEKAMEKLLELLEQDCTMPVGALAAAAGVS